MVTGKKIKSYITEHDLTYAEFGKLIGVSDAMVNYIVKGWKQPSVALLCRIAEVLGCPVDDLIVK